VQWNNNADLSGAAAVNAGGAWTSNQLGLSPGKIPSADMNVMLQASGATLWRVTGGTVLQHSSVYHYGYAFDAMICVISNHVLVGYSN
jgi:hypothetical protein